MSEKKHTNTQNSLCTPVRVAFTLVVLSLLAAFGISSCSSSDEKRTNPPAVVTNNSRTNPNAPSARNAPPAMMTTLPAAVVDAEMRAVSGSPIKLSDYAGKVLIVNLWATWCGPCRQETPELVKLHKEFRSQGLEVVGLSTEDPDVSAESVREFVHNYNVDYRVGWSGAQVAIALMQGRDAIPQSFVIARDGRVLKRFVGFNRLVTPDQIREAVQEALNAKGTAD
ncbi:MAG TPA: TlpA family protein disulfide reductase [Pyrinomonadaceae bacterium]|nr:TlpA family protein disulfide reductase [Pyrinomonadaceae bacterium]